MNETLLNAVTHWKEANHVIMTTEADDEGVIELRWLRTAGDWGYIDLFPEGPSIVIVQHGTFMNGDEREQRGINRFRVSEIEAHLTELKTMIDACQPARQWTYTPRVDIGSVASLKFR